MKRAVLAALCAAFILVAPAQAAEVPENADWTEGYFESGDGTRLHYDLLRPKGLAEDAKTPVIVTVSPYLNRSGATTPEDPTAEGPSNRFYDALEQGRWMERGYSYLMVDLRGFGGSAGCNDWGGPGEQMDSNAAVEWAAEQPWSTGKVGMWGKSYDGWTGLMAVAGRPEGLEAVVSMEPVYDGYRYLYMNRVRFLNSIATPTLFQAIDANPGSTGAGSEYVLNGASSTNPACYAENIAIQQSNNPQSDYWKERNLTPKAEGANTPTFLMQGFLEDNTKPDDAFTFWNNLAGPKRAWFGQWDHVRGNDKDPDTGAALAGREGFMDEAMRFLDLHLKGEPPAVADPPIVVEQGADGRFRSEDRWPPADSSAFGFDLLPGEYTDDAQNEGDATSGGTNGDGTWTFTPPFPHAAHLAGMPRIELDVETEAPEANLVANVYEISPEGSAQLLSRGAFLVPESGSYSFELYGQDWTIEPG
jgi:putative CocE/NonD family hydrolase